MRFLWQLLFLIATLTLAGCASLPQRYLQVSVRGGRVAMAPSYKAKSYRPVNFWVKPAACRIVNLYSVDARQYARLQACYQSDILLLQPLYSDNKLSFFPIRIFAAPFWEQGFTYRNLSTGGHPYLDNIIVTVRHHHASIKNPRSRNLKRGVLSSAAS